jgi:hypothetical protein
MSRDESRDGSAESASNNFKLGNSIYLSCRSQGTMLVDVGAIEQAIVLPRVAGDALYDLMGRYGKERVLDGKLAALYLRAICGWILRAGTDLRTDEVSRTFNVSLVPPTDILLRRCLRLLAMVAELHKAGYQKLRIVPGMSPSGAHWRCSITSADNVQANGWEPVSWERVVPYSSADKDRYFGWPDAAGKSARQLAQMFIDRFTEVSARGAGRDRAYAGWFVSTLGAAENGRLPICFADYELDLVESDMPPPPSNQREDLR